MSTLTTSPIAATSNYARSGRRSGGLILTGLVAIGLLAPTGAGLADIAAIRNIERRTGSLAADATPTEVDGTGLGAAAVAPEDVAYILIRARESIGFTWEQLASLFGVSRRSVHLWASGGKLNSRNESLVLKLRNLLATAPNPSNPTDIRRWLLTADSSGLTPIDKFKLSRLTVTSKEVNPPEVNLTGALPYSHVTEV